MSDGQGDNPARVIYDSLVSELRPTAARYRMLIAALRPLWIEEVVCPVNIAVRDLCGAAEAAESGNERIASDPGRHLGMASALRRGDRSGSGDGYGDTAGFPATSLHQLSAQRAWMLHGYVLT